MSKGIGPLRWLSARGTRAAAGEAERLLLDSPLFDDRWYAAQAALSATDRLGAVRHYLEVGRFLGLSPHPLLDPGFVAAQWNPQRRARVGDGDPLSDYVVKPSLHLRPHPLFDPGWYVDRVPEAADHPGGPLAHYIQIGAAAGLPANDWFTGDPIAWLMSRRDQHAAAPRPLPTPRSEPEESGTVTVIVRADRSGTATFAAVASVLASAAPLGRIECLVLDSGARPEVSALLDAVALRHPTVTVVSGGRAGAAEAAAGATVALLDGRCTVPPGWLAPLLTALDDAEVVAAQPLLLRHTGAIHSAGVLTTSAGDTYPFLQGFPAEDAAGVTALAFPSVESTAVLQRRRDLLAPRPGRFRVLPAEPVVVHGAVAPEPLTSPEQSDDRAAWAHAGFRILGREADGRPRVAWEGRFRAEPRPLRWAIKNAAVSGPAGDLWGDTHFADALAETLRELGHAAVVDRRGEFDRATGVHDDVALLLRGRLPLLPAPPTVSLAWVISHPDRVSAEELRGYDRVLAASIPWAERHAEEWGLRIDPLLQATDPTRFRPDVAEPDTGDRVLFVGSSRGVFRPIVRDALAAGLDLSVYGGQWEGRLPEGVWRAPYVDNAALPVAYRSAGVVLNDHWEDMRRDGFLSNRLFDAVACGARVITDDVAGAADLERIFGRSVQVYRTPGDLARLAGSADPADLDDLFGGAATRRATAERVRGEHSFRARAERLVAIAHEVRGERGLVA